ncbi:TetR family transcriptional regulator [Staphylococcus delphini]|uniref:TetR family transcriptional regulator n=1 Tax=Staphylococcus delphini TaxID=53344 RepID=A0A2A4GZG7_9STAP|nr:TetR/AcrR family transcriptional regulator [Staphylococcus delphini]PCF56747.1 TetR family transcriptional regulator [Staphylococcus delphini]PCF62915.1 TetR family transcriptional regulator [Staphylococcus delphini]PCF72617.1 TetR family transcriptional regulator [Staphylococcus delphini]HEC2157837.1 TetR/AcrR family transcriptional regulator [Staphylococcus delphini]
MRKDAIENRQRIEQQAKMMFERDGVDQVSMNQIAKALNIGMGTLYRHFEDKSALCYALVNNDSAQLLADLDAIQSQNDDVQTIFTQAIDTFLQFKTDHRELLHCIEMSQSKSDFRQTPLFQALHHYFYQLMDRGENEQQLTFQVDTLLNTLATQSYIFQLEERQLTNVELRDQLVALFLN